MSDKAILGSIEKPYIRALLWAKDNNDGTKTFYTTNPQVINIDISDTAPDFNSDETYPGIYVQQPE